MQVSYYKYSQWYDKLPLVQTWWLMYYTAGHIHKSRCQVQGCHSPALDIMSYSITKSKQLQVQGLLWWQASTGNLLPSATGVWIIDVSLCHSLAISLLNNVSSPFFFFLSRHFSPEIYEPSCISSWNFHNKTSLSLFQVAKKKKNFNQKWKQNQLSCKLLSLLLVSFVALSSAIWIRDKTNVIFYWSLFWLCKTESVACMCGSPFGWDYSITV